MSYPMVESARQNRILAALPLNHYARMAEQLTPVDLQAGQFIGQPGKTVDHVYFPTTCTASLVSTTQDGDTSELALVGRDGLLGVSLVLGSAAMNHRVMVQSAGRAWRMTAADFQKELQTCQPLHQLALCHVQALITQMAQSIVCSRHHAISERLSFWLLANLDVLPSEQLRVTHENIASMLGVRRESVTQALGKFQADGWVSNSRGKITIHDRDGLASQVCECFDIVKSESQRIFQRLVLPGGSTLACAVSSPWDQGTISDDVSVPQQALASLPPDAAQELLRKYQDVYDFAPVGFASLDEQGRVTGTNLAGAILLGLQRSQHQNPVLTGLLDDASREEFEAFQQEVLSGKCRRHCEVTLPAAGHRGEVVLRLDATVDESGEEVRLVMTDITAERQRMAQILVQQHDQQALLDHSPFMLWGQDAQGRVVAANASLKALMGDAQPGHAGFDVNALTAWLRDAQQVAEPGQVQEVPFLLNGQERWFELHHARYQGSDQVGLQLGYARDITERKLQEQRLRSLATLDSLTELPKRRYFMSRMEEMYSALRRDPRQQAFVVLLDLDHFKNINDQFGHVAGDGVLHDFARRLQTCFRDSDCVARLGGDEFGVLLHRTDTCDGQIWSERVREQITGTPFEMDAQSIRLAVSLGVSPLLATDETAQAAMLRADKALYQAKLDPHAAGPAGALAVGYRHDSETDDFFQWTAQGHSGATAQMSAGR